MAVPREPEKALFLCGVLAANDQALAAAGDAAAAAFGRPCLASATWDFTNTTYYRDELGESPIRQFWLFPGQFDPGLLAERKLMTNNLETILAAELGGPHTRPVNLDPGYITLAKLVLASAKNFSHRIYIGRSIYAEVTLQYRAGQGFVAFPWTFPDYASGRYDTFLLDARARVSNR